MSDLIISGAGDRDRTFYLRDNSKSDGGISEDSERGKGDSTTHGLVGFVDAVDEDGLITDETQAILQPRNWHLTRGDSIDSELPSVKDLRADVSLIADHEHDFPGWRLDEDEKSPYLDDWFLSEGVIQKSTRITDYRDKKGRTALLSQLIIVKDDHLGQYTAALNLGPEVGNHEKAAGGYVFDDDKEFLGQLATFFTTNHQDQTATGREGTPIGYLGMRHDAHIEFPGVDHGRLHIVRENCDDYEEMPKRLPGGGSAASDGETTDQQPQVHFYKSRLMYDHKVKGEESGLPKESAQLRPVYHCIDAPERPKKIVNNLFETNIFQEITNISQVTNNVTNNTTNIVIVVINQGGGGGGQIVEVFDLNKPGEPPTITETPGTGDGGKPPRDPPPQGPQGGRIICLPLSHNPPLLDGLEHTEHGYFAISDDGNGGQKGWIGGYTPPTPGSQVGSPDPAIFGPGIGGVGGVVLSAGWNQVVTVPSSAPAGKVPITDGNGGAAWGDAPVPPPILPPRPTSTAIVFDVLGYTPSTQDQYVTDGYVWEPDPNDPRIMRLQQRTNGSVIEEALRVDASSALEGLYVFGDLVIVKSADVVDGKVPVSSAGGVTWSNPASVGGAPKGYITGFGLSYDADFPSIVHVEPGLCRDTTNSYDINVGDPDVDYLTTGGPLFNDAVLNPSGLNGSSTSGTWSGDGAFGVSALSADIRPFLNERTLTGTIAVAARSGGTLLQKITGTGSLFLSQVAIGDLIGNATCGHGMVAQIDSDLVCWIVKEFSDLSSATYSAQTFKCYENVCVQVGVLPSNRISEIGKDGTHLYSPDLFNNGGASGPGLSVLIGQPAALRSWSTPPAITTPTWVYLWARRKADGTSTLSWSTQRTTPYTPTTLSGYSIWRRVGVLPLYSDNYVYPFTQNELGAQRVYEIEDATHILYVVNAASATAWTRASAQLGIPPVSTRGIFTGGLLNPTNVRSISFRAPGIGVSATESSKIIQVAASGRSLSELHLTTDGAQAIEWVLSGADANNPAFLWTRGYIDKP